MSILDILYGDGLKSGCVFSYSEERSWICTGYTSPVEETDWTYSRRRQKSIILEALFDSLVGTPLRDEEKRIRIGSTMHSLIDFFFFVSTGTEKSSLSLSGYSTHE